MTSVFDSEVYTERQRLPGVTVSVPKLMNALLWKSGEHKRGCDPVSITLEYRPEVETSSWWTVRLGEGQFAAATTFRSPEDERRGKP